MDFVNLTETQQAVLDLARDFARKTILPDVEKIEKAAVFPREIQKRAFEAGLLNLGIPEEYGGPGMTYLDFVMVTETLAWACAGTAGAVSLNTMIADGFLLGGNEEQKKKYLARLLNGETGSYAMTEPGAGSDVAGIQMTARPNGRGGYTLNGSKTWISNAEVASFFIVFAKTDAGAGHRGITAFVVERETKGLSVGANLPKLGQKAFVASEVFFENVEVSEAAVLGKPGEGFLLAMKVFDRSRPMVGAVGVGLSQRCLDESVNYSKTRTSMGKPIAAHQMVAAKIAEMGMRVEAARLLTYKSADMLDRNKRNTVNASYAKTFASDTAVWASSEAIQIFGGMGYSPEYPVEKLYRDAKVLQIYEGTNEIQRLIMARELTKE